MAQLAKTGYDNVELAALCDIGQDNAEVAADEAERLLGRRPAVFADLETMVRESVDLAGVAKGRHPDKVKGGYATGDYPVSAACSSPRRSGLLRSLGRGGIRPTAGADDRGRPCRLGAGGMIQPPSCSGLRWQYRWCPGPVSRCGGVSISQTAPASGRSDRSGQRL